MVPVLLGPSASYLLRHCPGQDQGTLLDWVGFPRAQHWPLSSASDDAFPLISLRPMLLEVSVVGHPSVNATFTVGFLEKWRHRKQLPGWGP